MKRIAIFSSKNGLFEIYVKIVAEAIRFIENDLFEFFGKKCCRERSSLGSKSQHVSSKNGLFELYVKIVAEAIPFIENNLFEFCGRKCCRGRIDSATIFT